jgi:GYF domain 2
VVAGRGMTRSEDTRRSRKAVSMNAEWYYVENDVTVGPASLADLAERLRRAKSEPCLVWTKGMSDWADAAAVPAISKLLRSVPTRSLSRGPTTRSEPAMPPKPTLIQNARRELVEYLAISAYLFVCFDALLFYKSAILRSDGIEFASFGLALVKALILGKFILVLQAIGVGERGERSGILLVEILKRSVLFLLLLVILNTVEEITLGFFHGRAISDVLGEMAGGTLPQAIAVCALLLLVLIPYFALRGLATRLGQGVLWKHLIERRYAQTPH